MTDIRTYMAYLTLYENNFRILHWKLAGPHFHCNHERFGGYYDHLGTLLDETAEQAITIGLAPVSSRDALTLLDADINTAIIIDPTLDVSGEAADVAANHMFEQLRSMASEIATDTSIPPEVADVFMDHARYFRIEGTYKLGRTLTEPSHAE